MKNKIKLAIGGVITMILIALVLILPGKGITGFAVFTGKDNIPKDMPIVPEEESNLPSLDLEITSKEPDKVVEENTRNSGGGGGSSSNPQQQESQDSPIDYTKVSLTQDSIVNNNSEFEVPIKIETGAMVYGVDIKLKFDPERLEIIEVQEGEFLKQDSEKTYPIIKMDNENGTAQFISTRFGVKSGVSGSGNLATLKFKAKKVGEATIEFDEVMLVDQNVNKIANVTLLNGNVLVA